MTHFHQEHCTTPRAKTIKKNTNSTPNTSQTQRARAYEVTSFLSTACELSTDTCSKNVYSLGPQSNTKNKGISSHILPKNNKSVQWDGIDVARLSAVLPKNSYRYIPVVVYIRAISCWSCAVDLKLYKYGTHAWNTAICTSISNTATTRI